MIALRDDLEFAYAIDCMVSYFHEADYNVSQYKNPESVLHGQVAIIADKYDCKSLYKLSGTLFARTMNTVSGNDWVAVASLIYDYTTPDLVAHQRLRDSVVLVVIKRPVFSKSILQQPTTIKLLRSTTDLATDILISWLHVSISTRILWFLIL